MHPPAPPHLPVVSRGCVSGYVDAPEDWGGVKPRPKDIQKALELLELNVPTVHWEAAGRVAWLLLAELWQASLEVQNQPQRVQQLRRQEEALETWWSVAAEHVLQDPEGSLPLSRSGSGNPPATPWQAQRAGEEEQQLARGAGPSWRHLPPPPPPKLKRMPPGSSTPPLNAGT